MATASSAWSRGRGRLHSGDVDGVAQAAAPVTLAKSWDASCGLGAVAEETISTEHVRTDTTVTECNIHWPTDSSLLWDTYRVAAREMSYAREFAPHLVPWRFHPKKIKKLHLFA